MKVFMPANILIPKKDREKFAVVACDQYTSEPNYWREVEQIVGDTPSALRITLPEIYLADKENVPARIDAINATMEQYLAGDVFDRYEDALVYVRRRQADGKVRKGLVGMIDLECYDYQKGSKKPVRATEGTVLSRIPPRVQIRKDAGIELPHVMLLMDDPDDTVLGGCAAEGAGEVIYDFTLMQNGGAISGALLSESEKARVLAAIDALCGDEEAPFLFAVGDGNHSLATAKACWEAKKEAAKASGAILADNDPARFALVEVVNIHDGALEFEPIYRAVFDADAADLMAEMKTYFAASIGDAAPQTFRCLIGEREETYMLEKPRYQLPVASLQAFLDEYVAKHPEVEVDYIHGEQSLSDICREKNAVGFLFEGMSKSGLFSSIRADGVLPRKTFSMGEAHDKRYYIEARVIK